MLATLIPNNCVWYVSPLKRAIQTAEALSKYVNYSKMVRENKLIEQNFGDWSGKKISEVWETSMVSYLFVNFDVVMFPKDTIHKNKSLKWPAAILHH